MTFMRVIYVKQQYVVRNWTPRRTGKGNVFKRSLAFCRGRPVQIFNQPITVQYFIEYLMQ